MLKLTALALMVLAAGKGKPAKEAPPEPCSPDKLKLGEVKKVVAFELPKDCKPKPPAIRVLVRSEKEFGERLTCPASAVSGVDFKQHMLVAMTKTLPANTFATDLWDERGKKVTVVMKQKSCPGDPKTEASTVTVAFLMDTDPVPPEFGEATCPMPCK